MSKENSPLKPFDQCTYIAQVHRLRGLAREALKSYKLKVSSIRFINHGENATFRVHAANGEKYLLRIHRKDYHSKAGIKDELRWLELLVKQGFNVPDPVRSRKGQTLITADLPLVGERNCNLFRWIDGRFLSRSVSESDMEKMGSLLARIQKKTPRNLAKKNRHYWSSEGLVGANPKFGSIDHLPGLRASDQRKITQARKALLSRLKSHESRYPEKMGTIHSDLHFGNLLKTPDGEIAAIDFGDCGFGFKVYDLSAPLIGLESLLLRHQRFHEYPHLKEALLRGYSQIINLTDRDLALLQDLLLARKLIMVGWLHSRSDNPALKAHVPRVIRRALDYIANPNL